MSDGLPAKRQTDPRSSNDPLHLPLHLVRRPPALLGDDMNAGMLILIAGIVCAAVAWCFSASAGAIGMSFFAGLFLGAAGMYAIKPYDYENPPDWHDDPHPKE